MGYYSEIVLVLGIIFIGLVVYWIGFRFTHPNKLRTTSGWLIFAVSLIVAVIIAFLMIAVGVAIDISASLECGDECSGVGWGTFGMILVSIPGAIVAFFVALLLYAPSTPLGRARAYTVLASLLFIALLIALG